MGSVIYIIRHPGKTPHVQLLSDLRHLLGPISSLGFIGLGHLGRGSGDVRERGDVVSEAAVGMNSSTHASRPRAFKNISSNERSRRLERSPAQVTGGRAVSPQRVGGVSRCVTDWHCGDVSGGGDCPDLAQSKLERRPSRTIALKGFQNFRQPSAPTSIASAIFPEQRQSSAIPGVCLCKCRTPLEQPITVVVIDSRADRYPAEPSYFNLSPHEYPPEHFGTGVVKLMSRRSEPPSFRAVKASILPRSLRRIRKASPSRPPWR